MYFNSHILLSLANLFAQFESYIKKQYAKIKDLEVELAEREGVLLQREVELAQRELELTQTQEQLEEAEAEIRRLKKLPQKPKLKPSNLDAPQAAPKSAKKSKRPGSAKKSKKPNLQIHEHLKVAAKDVPSGWVFKGYAPYVIQDLIIRANNIEYQREIWQSPDGHQRIVAALPKHLQGKHFGAVLQAYVLYQYNGCCVSQPLIQDSLSEFGVLISNGTINNILIEDKTVFHEEKDSLLTTAIDLKEELRTDDTGARHGFKNGFCNCINSDLFTYFTTTYSKSRINFLEILRQHSTSYIINEVALDYACQQELPPKYYAVLQNSYAEGKGLFEDETALKAYFTAHKWTAKYALRTITQALLIGTLTENGFDPENLIHSDGAGQFKLFAHSLCWKHAERPLVKLRTYNDTQQQQLDTKKEAFWKLYQALKAYKQQPEQTQIAILEQQFEELCEPVSNFNSLNQVLEELKKKKDELLLVLKRPRASLHNNDSERDIREYAKRRKISAGTRSENGRKARDTFLSLKKTCRKLGISFWEYLLDRLRQDNKIPPLSVVMVNHKTKTANR